MKKSLFLFTALLVAAGVSAQDKITVDGLQSFNTLYVGGKIELVVTMDPTRALSKTIELNGNDQTKVKWGLDKTGTLSIKFPGSKKDQPVKVTLNCHTLTTLTLDGASMATDPQTTWQDKIVTINLNGGARLTAQSDITDLRVVASGSSAATITGNGRYATFIVRSKSEVDARNLDVRSATIVIDGGSQGYICGRDRIAIEAPGASSVFYRGTPDILRIDAVKAARINPLGK